MNRKRHKLFFCILILYSVIGCSNNLEDRLLKIVDENYQNNNCNINFRNIINEDWENIFIIEENIIKNDITSAIGFEYKGEMVPDGQYKLIITNKNQVLEECIYDRNRVIFKYRNSDSLNGTGITKISINDTFCAKLITKVKPNYYFLERRLK